VFYTCLYRSFEIQVGGDGTERRAGLAQVIGVSSIRFL
jgi:hypothetical protein